MDIGTLADGGRLQYDESLYQFAINGISVTIAEVKALDSVGEITWKMEAQHQWLYDIDEDVFVAEHKRVVAEHDAKAASEKVPIAQDQPLPYKLQPEAQPQQPNYAQQQPQQPYYAQQQAQPQQPQQLYYTQQPQQPQQAPSYGGGRPVQPGSPQQPYFTQPMPQAQQSSSSHKALIIALIVVGVLFLICIVMGFLLYGQLVNLSRMSSFSSMGDFSTTGAHLARTLSGGLHMLQSTQFAGLL